jgi:hypothetical protein
MEKDFTSVIGRQTSFVSRKNGSFAGTYGDKKSLCEVADALFRKGLTNIATYNKVTSPTSITRQ